ncbi:MAG: hypothetical protein EPN60_09080 [Nevskiaceae bacterium]|nr:MAG: hypothetical protein EPO48_00880 [Nevskiaceae bacterium]TAM27046.1 MAG: hypothetical protein EPN60_09080 [Nevskiaceae bacterium]
MGLEAPALPVTGVMLPDGSYHVLSCLGDDEWVLPDALFPANAQPSAKVLRFSLAPACFRSVLKACTLRYYLVGLEGSVRPRGATIFGTFSRFVSYLRYLDSHGVSSLRDATPFHGAQYVQHCRALKSQKGESIGSSSIKQRLQALEYLHALSQHTATPMAHPWPESSSAFLAGATGDGHYLRLGARTKIIPDEVMAPFFQHCVAQLDKAADLIALQSSVLGWRRQGLTSDTITARLRKQGWDQRRLADELDRTVDACAVIIFDTSGVRVSELASLNADCAYTKVKDGERYYWMKGVSEKLGHGAVEWLVAEITHRAIAVAVEISAPLREQLRLNISRSRSPQEIASMKAHADAVFLVRHGGRAARLSNATIQDRINILAERCGIDWRFANHQFRRTFAVYAAHSALGDLRYLREHFKHWSLDMTALYAMNRQQDAELYDDIGHAFLETKIGLLENWLEEDAILTGGGAEPIKTFRAGNQALVTKADRREMAETISPLVHIRATGVAWCLADAAGCAGGTAAERTRCGDCSNAVIDKGRQPIWSGIYRQQLELRDLRDIGEGGRQRVERDLERARRVLVELGANEEELVDETSGEE